MTKVRVYVDILVDRLWHTYAWPERGLPMRTMTPEKLRRYPVQSAYVSDDARTLHAPKRAWDYGRIRYFYETLRSGGTVDPIEIDSDRVGPPVPVLYDGHHRLAAAWLACCATIPAYYGGRVDLLRYLTGQRKTLPLDAKPKRG